MSEAPPLYVIHPLDVARYEEVFGPIPTEWATSRPIGWTEPDPPITRLVFPTDPTVHDAVEAACRG